MSYDVHFVKSRPGQSLREVMEDLSEELETAAETRPELTPEAVATWNRLAPRVKEMLPDAEIDPIEYGYQVVQGATGIQLFFCPPAISLHVPYWYDGDRADQILGNLRALALVVEAETGLTAYDPQTDGPFLTGQPEASRSSFRFARKALDELRIKRRPDSK